MSSASPTPLRRLFLLLSVDKADIFRIFGYAILMGFISLSLPLGVQAVISLIVGGTFNASLNLLIALVSLGVLVSGGIQVMQMALVEALQQKIFARSALEFAHRIPRLHLERFRGQYPPELVNRFFDTLTIQKGLPKLLIDSTGAAVQILYGMTLVAFYHPLFVFVGVLLLFSLVLMVALTGPPGLRSSLLESKFKYAVVHWLEEVARVLRTFKLAGDNPLPVQHTDELVTNYLKARKTHFRILVFQFSGMVLFKTLVAAGLLFVGAYLTIRNEITVGQFVASEIVIILVMSSVEKLILSMETIFDMLTGVEKIGNVTDLALEAGDGREPLAVEDCTDRHPGLAIEARDLVYRHRETDRIALRGLSFSAEPGERVLIAGSNGSGKSTLINLLSGLMGDNEGIILGDGISFHHMNRNALRQRIGDYTAGEDLFRGSLLENIAMGKAHVSQEAVDDAVRRTGLEPLIQSLPKGLLTEVEPTGRTLPRSAVARVILARSIADRPRLLALEGLFEAFNPQEKQRLLDELMGSNRTWTLFAVSNDPQVAYRCDRILVLDEGRLVANGNPEEVLQNPRFHSLFYPNQIHPNGGNSSTPEAPNPEA